LSAVQGDPPAEVLLGRPVFAGDIVEAAGWLLGRRVLVTGAAGSVGWPLAHSVSRARPAVLALVDHHEHSLFSLERSLGPASAELVYELLDLRDSRRLARLFESYRPEVVFHLAAAKHVPYGERFPEGVVEVNVLATATLLRLADSTGTETVVYPSSDKSVAPPSLYGATKRLCEALVQRWAAARRRGLVVRFVNIIGTRGSVIETFVQQVLAGRALSVTDERMTRYWISMDEAVWLLLETGRLAAPGDVVLPACGDPVPLLETARRLAAWYCPERDPYPIVLSGIRPGERLHEILLSDNEAYEPGPAGGLRVIRSRRDPARLEEVPTVVDTLRGLVRAGDSRRIREVAMGAGNALQ
jgi:FlaA1/EpsC-like NDP-sugar epimerase